MTNAAVQTGKESGFTLVEVLVSFAILAGAIILNMQIAADGMRRLNQADEKLRALAVAQEVLAEVELDPPQGNEVREGNERGFVWRVEAKEMGRERENGQQGAVPLLVEVSVGLSYESNRHLIELDEVVVQPTPLPQ